VQTKPLQHWGLPVQVSPADRHPPCSGGSGTHCR
jgi:hypothetical protein